MRKSKTDNLSQITKTFVPGIFFVLGVWIISQFFYQVMLIRGESMLPAYRDNQLVLLDKHSRDYQQGDVIAFWCEDLEAVLVKRIAAVEGSTVHIQSGRFVIDGEEIPGVTAIDSGIAGEVLTIPENCFFVLGDNMEHSVDSRFPEVGIVEMQDILGEVLH